MPPTSECEANRNYTGDDVRRSKKFDHLISETREILHHKLTTEVKYLNTYYNFDLERAMNDSYQVRRFLHKANGSIELAVKSIIASFQWIKSNKLRDLRESDFPGEVFLLGAVFPYEKDKFGRPTNYMRVKNHVLIKELTKLKIQFIYYLALMTDDEAGEDGVTIVVDLNGISISHLDLEMALSLSSMREHLPYSAAYVILVDLPFIARTGFNLIKYALPTELRELMVVIDRKDLTKYIDINNIPKFLGGKCKTPYSGPEMVPPGSITSAEYARKVLKLKSDRIEKIAKLCLPLIEAARREAGWELDANENVFSRKTLNKDPTEHISNSDLALTL